MSKCVATTHATFQCQDIFHSTGPSFMLILCIVIAVAAVASLVWSWRNRIDYA